MDISPYESLSLDSAPHVNDGIMDDGTVMDISPYEQLDNAQQVNEGDSDERAIMDISFYEPLDNASHVNEGIIDEGIIMDISSYEPLDNASHVNEGIIDERTIIDISSNEPLDNASHVNEGIIDERTIIMDISHYEPFNNAPQVNEGIIPEGTIMDIFSYEPLNNDLQGYEVSSNVNSVTLNGFPNPPVLRVYLDLLNETASIHGNEYDVINTYDYISIGNEPLTTDEEQRSTHSPINRPLPVLPLSIYEPLNTNAGTSNDPKIVYRRVGICITKIILILAALVGVFVTGGFIAIKMLPTKVDDQKGELFVHSIFV